MGITSLRIMTLRISTVGVTTLNINGTQGNDTEHKTIIFSVVTILPIMRSVFMLIVIMLRVLAPSKIF